MIHINDETISKGEPFTNRKCIYNANGQEPDLDENNNAIEEQEKKTNIL
jgi:hypothetical protein